MIVKLLLAFLLIFSSVFANAQSKPKASAQASTTENTSPLRRADVISVKAALEEMLVRRYAQELSAIVSYDKFNVGARFELSVVDDKDAKRNLNNGGDYTDLDLGYLDADTLFDRYANVDSGSVSPLAKYAIKSVAINIGLQQDMGEKNKKTVDDWLQNRIKEEFGNIAKGQVQFIQSEKSNPTTLDRIIQMQGLFGQLILALAILLGVLLWRILGGGASNKDADSAAINIQSKSEMTAGEGLFASGSSKDEAKAQELAIESKIEHLSEQVKDLAPKLVDQLEQLITQWCDQGEDGLMQIACFAEISGSVIGSLPIPTEHKKKMGDVFSRMAEINLENRYDLVNRTYWDLVASLNLGTEALHRPFSFIGNATLGTVSKVLLGNDADIQTVVSLYMPENMRKNYFSKLESDKKIELLNNAAKLSSISHDKLKKIESEMAPYFEEKVDEAEVSLSMTLSKLIESMSLVDACKLMPQVNGPMVDEYKLKHPHIAFFADWVLSAQETLIKKATNEELMAYVRIMPNMTQTVLELVSPRAKQILEDDLSRTDNMPEAEKERLILSLHNRLLNLIYSNTLVLEDCIKKNETSNEDIRVAA